MREVSTAAATPARGPGRKRVIALAVLLIAVFGAALATGYRVAHRTADAVGPISARTACGGVGVADIKALLGADDTARIYGTQTEYDLTGGTPSDTTRCRALTPSGAVDVTTTDVPAAVAAFLKGPGGARSLPLGDGAKAWPDGVRVHITCRQPDAAARYYGLTITTSGTATGTDARHRARLTDLARQYTRHTITTRGCTNASATTMTAR